MESWVGSRPTESKSKIVTGPSRVMMGRAGGLGVGVLALEAGAVGVVGAFLKFIFNKAAVFGPEWDTPNTK